VPSRFGQQITGLTVDGRLLRAPVFNENEARAAAALTMVVGAVAFAYAYFEEEYLLLQIASSVFLAEFLIRVTLGLRASPFGLLARALTRTLPPDWVSAKPKRFAWTIGLGMAFAMTIITNSGVRGWLPRSLCLVCLTLMWLEAALGLCLGCKVHALLVRRGLAERDPAFEICAGGECALPQRAQEPAALVDA
jgi:hypothetical protein